MQTWALTVPDAPQLLPEVQVLPDEKVRSRRPNTFAPIEKDPPTPLYLHFLPFCSFSTQRLISSMLCVELESLPGSPLIITGHISGWISIRDVGSGLALVASLGAGMPGQPGHTGPVRVLTQGLGDTFYSGGADDGTLSLWQCVVAPPAAAGP